MALTYQHGSSGDGGDQYSGLDRFGRVTDLRWNKTGTALVSSQYGYDRNSNQRWRKDVAAAAASVNTEDQMFWYDGLQQVSQRQRGTLTPTTPPYTGITGLQQTEAFSFDETGNWLGDYNSTGGPLSQSRTHNKANEIASLTGPTGVVQPVYSAAGNSTTVPQPDNWATSHTLKWDAWSRLAEVTTAGTAYTYDALFRRIRIAVGGSDHDYYYTDSWQVSEVFVGSTLSWRAFWGLRDLNDIIKRDGSSGLGTSLYGLRDKLNFAATTDASGTVNLRIAYDTFGQARYLTSAFAAGSNTYSWNFLFHGYEWDAQSGFLAVRFRTYHPTLGRWLNRDPIGERGGINLYGMVGNNPLYWYDLLGLQSDVCSELSKKITEAQNAIERHTENSARENKAFQDRINAVQDQLDDLAREQGLVGAGLIAATAHAVTGIGAATTGVGALKAAAAAAVAAALAAELRMIQSDITDATTHQNSLNRDAQKAKDRQAKRAQELQKDLKRLMDLYAELCTGKNDCNKTSNPPPLQDPSPLFL